MRIALLWLLLFIFLPFSLAQDFGNLNLELDFQDRPVLEEPHYARKETDLREALKKDPDSTELRLNLARFYQTHRFYSQARELLDFILQKQPDNAAAHYHLGQILRDQKGDGEESLSELREAVRLDPERLEYREELIGAYFRLQRYPLALEQLDEVLRRDPDRSNARYRKAVILYTQGNIAEAEVLVDDLPRHEHARVLKAVIVQQRGQDAEPLYKAILRDYPQNLRARYEYGKILLNQKQYAEAQELFERIVDEDPFYQHAIFQLVRIYTLTGEKTKAQLVKQSLDTINRMGRSQRRYYRTYLQHHPDTAETHLALGLIYLEIGRGNLAAREFQTVLKKQPDHPEAPFYLAQISMAGGEFKDALPFLETCLRVRKNPATIHALMAQCYLETGDAPNAHEHLQTALRINPNEPLARRLQELWSSRGRKAE